MASSACESLRMAHRAGVHRRVRTHPGRGRCNPGARSAVGGVGRGRGTRVALSHLGGPLCVVRSIVILAVGANGASRSIGVFGGLHDLGVRRHGGGVSSRGATNAFLLRVFASDPSTSTARA